MAVTHRPKRNLKPFSEVERGEYFTRKGTLYLMSYVDNTDTLVPVRLEAKQGLPAGEQVSEFDADREVEIVDLGLTVL